MIREPRLWIALCLITIHAGLVFAGPGPDSWTATLCIIVAELAASAGCFLAAAKSTREARLHWLLLGSAILLAPFAATFFTRAEIIGMAGTESTRDAVLLLKACYGAVLLFTITSIFDPRVARPIRVMGVLLTAAAGGLFLVMSYSAISARGSDRPEDLLFFARLFEAIVGFIALIATLRVLNSEGKEMRGFFFAAAVFLWSLLGISLLRIQWHAFFQVDSAAVFITAPFLFLFVLAGRDPPRILRDWKPSPVLFAVLRHAAAFSLCLGLLVTGMAVSRIHFWLGSAAVLLAVLCYMLLNVITRSQSVRTSEALLAENQKLGQLAEVDGLTGIANRRAFDARLQLEIGSAQRSGQPLSLLMIDVDLFKKFNDSLGHPAGDSCLVQVASAVSGALARATDFAARYGGEEFAVILPLTDREGALRVADAVHSAVFGLSIVHPASPFGRVTVSIGAATASGAADCLPAALIGTADRALYSAKTLGRNRSEYEAVGQEASR